MNPRKAFEYGGYIAGAVLIIFGAAAIFMGANGRSTVRDSLEQEKIVFGDAAEDEDGNPIPNGPRNTWVTETALATALNMSYMAEQLGLFAIVVGVALLLAGIGFIILAFYSVRAWAHGATAPPATSA